MEESFDVFQELIARRLIAGVGTKQRQGTVSEETQNPEIEKTRTEQRLVMPEKQDLTAPDFVRIEKNIAAFGFFTPSSKRIKNVPKVLRFSQTIEGRKVEAEVIISGSMQYGMPITADQDKYLAFQKIIDRVKQAKGRVENPIKFTTAELLALLGSSKNGNRYKEVSDWLKVMKGTTIESNGAVWVAGKKRFATDVFSIFDRIRSLGDELDDGTIADQNYVWLSDWYLENLNNFYLLPIDFEAYKQLKNHIAKALIPLLQIWLYASREVGRFEKRYSEICQTLNITQYKKISDIKRRFGNSLDELVEHQYLESWTIEKTADQKDFKIIFHHGLKFYSDRARAKRNSKEKLAEAKNAPLKPEKIGEATLLLFEQENAKEDENFASGGESEVLPEPPKSENLPDTVTDLQREVIKRLFVEFGISIEKATELIKNNLEEAKKQLEVYPFRNIQPKNKAGYLIDAIEKSYSLPDAYLEDIKLQAERKAKEEYEERMRIESELFVAEQEKLIAACRFCNEQGNRTIKHPEDPKYKAFHSCTHNEAIESQLADWK
ncbi:MAG: replication initiator protein A [Acidobacteriota bacterium]|nr:replication initiator protein A [Acidobacteriota bacterium]